MDVSAVGASAQTMYMRPPPPPAGEDANSEEFALEASTQFLEDADADGDGVLSIEETEFSEEDFASIDADEDGTLSQAELQTDLETKMAEGGPPPPPPGGMGGMGGFGGMESSELDLATLLMEAEESEDYAFGYSAQYASAAYQSQMGWSGTGIDALSLSASA